MSYSILVPGPVTQDLITACLDEISKRTDAGEHSCFIGQVRADNISGKRVKAIEYSAYKKMVRSEADQIIKMIRSEFNDVKSIVILQSLGVVKAGEISLFVLVSAGHHHHAIQACSKTVELIKEKLPVWKKEIFEDNSHEWKQNNLA
jgi:molybdopterin synthase catalytic subunit